MEKNKITIHNKISHNYRQIHVDGAFGGITSRGLVNISFFAERSPIPKSSEYEIVENQLGPLLSNSDDSKSGMIREFEFGIYTDINVAKQLIEMLTKQVEIFEKLNLNK